MNQHRLSPFVLFSAVVLTIGVVMSPALAQQSPAELRQENQQLRAEVHQLEQELEAAKNRIAALENQLIELQRRLREGARSQPTAPTTPPPKITIDVDDPAASPLGLRNTLMKEYQEATDGLEQGEPGDRARTNYVNALRRWIQRSVRANQIPVDWHVRIRDETETRLGLVLRLQAVDPVSDAELGDPFDVLLSAAQSRRLQQAAKREALGVLQLKGILRLEIAVDESYVAPGPFGKERFIGPFVRYEFTIDVKSLMPATAEKPKGGKPADAADA